MAGSASHVENRSSDVLGVDIAVLCVSTVFVILRLVSRIGVVKRVTPDDYFIILAWFIAFGFSFSICYGTSVGLGRHEVDVKPEWQEPLKKAEYAFSNPALMATKTSICLFYLTLAKNQRAFKWATLVTLAVVNVAGIALTFLNIFQCHPVGAAFEHIVSPGQHCTDIITIYLSSAPVNIVTDLALLFLPMPILTAMRLPRNEKLILIVTFSFGAFVAVVDVVRIAYLESATLTRLQNSTEDANKNDQGDFSWIASLSFMWSAVEVHVGIICACVPGVKPLAAKVFPSLLGKIKHSKDPSRNSYGPEHASPPTTAPRRPNHIQPQTPPESPTAPRHLAVNTAAHQNGNMESLDFVTTPEGGRNRESKRQEEDLDIMDFLTTPDTPTTMRKTDTAFTADTWKSRSASLTPYDFVNMNGSKSLVKRSNRESLAPIAFVTILFFLWGFAYGLLDVLNSQFRIIVQMSNGQSIGLHSAYYGAYFVAPLTFGRIVFQKCGFKFTFIVGLCVYGIGTLVFWPSAVLASFPAFLISNFIIGLGVATLELAGNPFIALCGPPEYAEVRLNISQAIQAIGTVVSPVLAKKVLFRSVLDAPSLIDVQWAYLGIALFVVILALVFYYVPLPEASDNDLQDVALKNLEANIRRVGPFPVIYVTLALGLFSNFCYVGGQEAVSTQFQNYVAIVKPEFLSAFAGLLIKPRWILLFLYAGVIVTSALAMSLEGYSGVAMIVLVLLFESGIFSIIFAMCIRGLGTRTKFGSVALTAATSGGAIIPAIMSAVSDHRGLRYSLAVAVAVFAFGALLPIYVCAVPAAKNQVDPIHAPHRRRERERRPSTPHRTNHILGALKHRNKVSSDMPSVDHVESNAEKEAG
ncbi:MAG: hypothetical protein Q9191_004733 [Dirinaria sp. TL-2023a]